MLWVLYFFPPRPRTSSSLYTTEFLWPNSDRELGLTSPAPGGPHQLGRDQLEGHAPAKTQPHPKKEMIEAKRVGLRVLSLTLFLVVDLWLDKL
jgi:hypothetical protein